MVKRNQVFNSALSDSRIRVKTIDENFIDSKRSLIGVVNIDKNGRAVKKSARVIFQDSIRRRYVK